MSNSAFVFIKPHAVTEKTINCVREHFIAKGFTINGEGRIDGTEIESKKLIDQHYYAIASKATLLKPEQLNVPEDKFEAKFGLPWKQALKEGKCFNALDAAAKLGMSSSELDTIWAKAKKGGALVKFGGGFYCGEIKPGMYVFNGFFMSMREKYVKEGAGIYYFTITWPESKYSWADFRGEVLGATDPENAPSTSIRNIILQKWESLGLPSKPNIGDNGVHASASPLEAFCERRNWLGVKTADDSFGQKLAACGITEETMDNWGLDPQVSGLRSEDKSSLWDSLEDKDTSVCLDALLPGMVPSAKSDNLLTVTVGAGLVGFVAGYFLAKY
jgi:nucleoside diphosphate kinase